MDSMIGDFEGTLRSLDPREIQTPPRDGFSYRHPTTGLLEWMPTLNHGHSVTVKTVGYHPENPRSQGLPTILSTVASYDTRNGHLLALADATFLTALRTGAATAVATKHLASAKSRALGVIGSGAQAVSQLHAISRVQELDTVVEPAEILREADILVTATSVEVGHGPVFPDGEHRPWLHINGVGSDFPGKTEIPVSVLQRAIVVPDFLEQARKEGESQQLRPDEVGPGLMELVKDPARHADAREKLTVFDSTGWALEDHVALELLIRHARELGLGTELNIESISPDPHDPYAIGSRVVLPFRASGRRR
jgi:ornithine cyclodeaminase/alanine dehydrogenase-like protein (mu-crystallin family)